VVSYTLMVTWAVVEAAPSVTVWVNVSVPVQSGAVGV